MVRPVRNGRNAPLVVSLVTVIIVCLGAIGILSYICNLYRHEAEPLDPPVKSWVDAYWEEEQK